MKILVGRRNSNCDRLRLDRYRYATDAAMCNYAVKLNYFSLCFAFCLSVSPFFVTGRVRMDRRVDGAVGGCYYQAAEVAAVWMVERLWERTSTFTPLAAHLMVFC